MAPVRVTGDKLRGCLFARDARRALEIHVVGLKHIKARDATDHALLYERLGEVSLLDIVLIQHEDFEVLRRRDEEATVGGYAFAAQHALCFQCELVCGGLRRSRLCRPARSQHQIRR